MRAAILVLAFAALPSCVLIKRGTHHDVRVTSDPPGAHVEFLGQRGKTPCTLRVRRGSAAARLVAWAPEHKTFRGEIEPRQDQTLDGVDILLCIPDGLLVIPAIADIASGCLWDWPLGIHVDLPEQAADRNPVVALARNSEHVRR